MSSETDRLDGARRRFHWISQYMYFVLTPKIELSTKKIDNHDQTKEDFFRRVGIPQAMV